MTDEEFTVVAKRLFVAFPSTWEWLRSTSEPAGTQAAWRDCLRPYSLEECLSVVTRWSNGELDPPRAFDRDKTHLWIRAVVERDRGRQRAKNESRELTEMGRRREQGSVEQGIKGRMDSEMRAAYEELRPIHARHLAGELIAQEYASEKSRVIEHHLGSRDLLHV